MAAAVYPTMNALLDYLTENCCQGNPAACGLGREGRSDRLADRMTFRTVVRARLPGKDTSLRTSRRGTHRARDFVTIACRCSAAKVWPERQCLRWLRADWLTTLCDGHQ
jgi:hypothetical protein